MNIQGMVGLWVAIEHCTENVEGESIRIVGVFDSGREEAVKFVEQHNLSHFGSDEEAAAEYVDTCSPHWEGDEYVDIVGTITYRIEEI